MTDVLLCTDTFWAQWGDRVRGIAPDIEAITLVEGQQVSEHDLSRITIAFFSHDAWPERAANFFGAALRAPNLAWLHTMSAGVDSPVFDTMKDRGVRLTNSSGSSSAPIARTVIMYLLALARDLPRMMRAQADGEWAWERWSELTGKRVAVVGFGPIGQEVIRLTQEFGMKPMVVRRSSHGSEPCPVRTLDELPVVASEVDALVVALPLHDETRGIISAAVIGAMRTDAFFINVGRGELVDQAALTKALAQGRLGGAGLDVTDPEPLPSDHPLWRLPNVIITPHNSGSTDGTARRASEKFLTNLAAWSTGGALLFEV